MEFRKQMNKINLEKKKKKNISCTNVITHLLQS